MQALQQFMESLGDLTKILSPEEVQKLYELHDEMAEVFFLMWFERLKKTNNKNYQYNKTNTTHDTDTNN